MYIYKYIYKYKYMYMCVCVCVCVCVYVLYMRANSPTKTGLLQKGTESFLSYLIATTRWAPHNV